MKRLAALLALSTLCIAADALTELKNRLRLSAAQQDAIVILNHKCDEFLRAKNEAAQRLQAKRAVNPAANVSSALEELHSNQWNKLVETNAAVRAVLSAEQREEADRLVQDGKLAEFVEAAAMFRMTKDVKLARANGPSMGPVTQLNSGAEISAKPSAKGK